MFGIGPVEMALGLVILFLLEIVLFWAAAALVDAPPMGWKKRTLVVLLVTALGIGLTGALAAYTGMTKASFDPEQRPFALMVVGIGLVILWAVPALLYPLLASVSILRGMRLSLFQLLLRGFLYVFLAAIFMVGLAIYQIFTGPEARSERMDRSPPPLTASAHR